MSSKLISKIRRWAALRPKDLFVIVNDEIQIIDRDQLTWWQVLTGATGRGSIFRKMRQELQNTDREWLSVGDQSPIRHLLALRFTLYRLGRTNGRSLTRKIFDKLADRNWRVQYESLMEEIHHALVVVARRELDQVESWIIEEKDRFVGGHFDEWLVKQQKLDVDIHTSLDKITKGTKKAEAKSLSENLEYLPSGELFVREVDDWIGLFAGLSHRVRGLLNDNMLQREVAPGGKLLSAELMEKLHLWQANVNQKHRRFRWLINRWDKDRKQWMTEIESVLKGMGKSKEVQNLKSLLLEREHLDLQLRKDLSSFFEDLIVQESRMVERLEKTLQTDDTLDLQVVGY